MFAVLANDLGRDGLACAGEGIGALQLGFIAFFVGCFGIFFSKDFPAAKAAALTAGTTSLAALPGAASGSAAVSFALPFAASAALSACAVLPVSRLALQFLGCVFQLLIDGRNGGLGFGGLLDSLGHGLIERRESAHGETPLGDLACRLGKGFF